jgi:hypothetical protein
MGFNEMNLKKEEILEMASALQMGGLVTYVFEDPYQLLAIDLEVDPPVAFLINQRQQFNDYVANLRPVAQQELLSQLFVVGLDMRDTPAHDASGKIENTPPVSPSPASNANDHIRKMLNDLEFLDYLDCEDDNPRGK